MSIVKKARAWTKKEDCILMQNYKYGVEYCTSILDRSASSVYQRAVKIGIGSKAPKRWTQVEDNYIREKYPEVGPTQIFLEGRTQSAIQHRANILGVRYQKESNKPGKKRCNMWTKEEEEVLLRYYEAKGPKYCSEILKERTETACTIRARKLNLKYNFKSVPFGDRWSNEDSDTIKELFEKGTSREEIAKSTNRSNSSIKHKLSRLGLANADDRVMYSDYEKSYIVQNVLNIGYAKCAKELNRTYESVYSYVGTLIDKGALPKDSREKIKRSTNACVNWTEYEISFLIENYSILEVDKIAEALGRNLPSVYHKASKLGLISKIRSSK